jgi:hypothetical protein
MYDDLDDEPEMDQLDRATLTGWWLMMSILLVILGSVAAGASLEHGGPVWPYLLSVVAVSAVQGFCSAMDTIRH